MNPLLALDDEQLFDVIRARLDDEDQWLFDEAERRYLVALFRKWQAERRVEGAAWVARTGAQS